MVLDILFGPDPVCILQPNNLVIYRQGNYQDVNSDSLKKHKKTSCINLM